MNNQSKPQIIEHIIYPYTPITKEIFLKERNSNDKDIYKGDKKIATQQVSVVLEQFLTQKGYTIRKTQSKHLSGRKRVYGVKLSVSTSKANGEIKEIIVTIGANDQEELFERKKILINGVKSITNVSCKTATSDKFVRC